MPSQFDQFDLLMWRAAARALAGKVWTADAPLRSDRETNCTVAVNTIFREVYPTIDWDPKEVHADMMVRAERPWSAIERTVALGLGVETGTATLQAGWYFIQDWKDSTPGAPKGGHMYLVQVEGEGERQFPGHWKVQSARGTPRWVHFYPGTDLSPRGVTRRVVFLYAPATTHTGDSHAL